jgi:HSP20 family molecular chaperone IbpA
MESTERLNRSGNGERPSEKIEFAPAVDIYDRGEEIVLIADMPGVPSDGADVHYDRGTLSIRGRVAEEVSAGRRTLQEFGVGDYARSFTVSEEVDPAGIAAELKNGVLTLRLAKAAEKKPRKIEVRTA